MFPRERQERPGVRGKLQPWWSRPPEVRGEEFLGRKASACQVCWVVIGPDVSPVRGREDFCDRLDTIGNELL